MGLIKRFTITKEPDMKRTVKKIVQVQAPCTAEMMALLDCFKRFTSNQADTACTQHRAALAMCAKSAKVQSASSTKKTFYSQLERLGSAWKRHGF